MFTIHRLFFSFKYSFSQRKTWLNLVLAFSFFGLYFFLSHNPFIEKIQLNKTKKLKAAIQIFNQNTENPIWIDKLLEKNFNNISSSELESLEQDYTFYHIYDAADFKLKFWSQSSIGLNQDQIENQTSGLKFFQNNDNYYLIKFKKNNGKYIVFWFDIVKYFRNNLPVYLNLFKNSIERKEFNILAYTSTTTHAVNSSKGEFLFSVGYTNYSQDIWILLELILLIGTCFFFIKSLFSFGEHLAKIYSGISFLVVFSIIYFLRKLFLYFKFPSILYSLKLFNPALYSSDLTPSLGDLFIFVASTQLIIVFGKRYLNFNFNKYSTSILGWLLHTLILIFLLGEAFSVNKIFERLIIESSIWFNFNFFPRLTIYSFIGFAILMLTFSNYFLLSNFGLKNIVNINLSKTKIFTSFIIVLIGILIFCFFTNYKFEIKSTLFILYLFLIISYSKYYFNYRNQLVNLFLFLFFATTTTTFLLNFYNIKKEQIVLSSIATNVAFGHNKTLESDLILYLKNKSNSNDSSQLYFHKLENVQFTEINSKKFQELLSTISNAIISEPKLIIYLDKKIKLYFSNTETDKKYIVEALIGNQKKYYLISPKDQLNAVSIRTKEAINDLIIRDNSINYAIYNNDTLVESSGLFSYSKNLANIDINNIEESSYDHSFFKISNHLKVVITTSKLNTVSVLTQYSYIFCFYLLLFILLNVLAHLLKLSPNNSSIIVFNNLRNKILFSMFMIVISIFSGIAYFSYTSLKTKFSEYNREILINNLKFSTLAIDNFKNENKNISLSTYASFFNNLAKENNLIYTIYSQEGKKVFSSDKSTLNNSINYLSPISYLKLNKESSNIFEVKSTQLLFDQYEALTKIQSNSNLSNFYISISSQLNNSDRSDSTKLIVVLLNLYIILFLISMLFALWMANKITNPLLRLTEKISNITISKHNEYLEYKYEDEIGDLVKRYNLMVDKIELSAKQLATSEREEAWAEMAKQIAHEIKNPLTPMKLKIQFLQSKIKAGEKDLNQLTLNVADTLIEQINNLDNIAGSFADFSRLHTPEIREYEWSKIIQNIIYTFDNADSPIFFTSTIKSAWIKCDQNQMTSCLNNLIKNAIQARSDKPIKIDISLMENKLNYILEIKDNGVGISNEYIDKIFTPKFTTKSSGTGLGLAITKKIVESFDGKIDFKTELNRGTSFYISLPKINNKSIYEYTELEKEWIKKGFLHIQNDSIYSNLLYSQSENVFKTTLYTKFNKPFLHSTAILKLNKAAENLSKSNPNFKLIVLDALRPYAIQQLMWDIYNDENKELYIASPERDSMHNYGMAIDVMIIEEYQDSFTSNKYLDFGCLFDEFSEKSHFSYSELSFKQKQNRELLREVMINAGFISYENEFWHFETMDKFWVRNNCERI